MEGIGSSGGRQRADSRIYSRRTVVAEGAVPGQLLGVTECCNQLVRAVKGAIFGLRANSVALVPICVALLGVVLIWRRRITDRSFWR